jgi:hypothetical protein
VSLLVQGWRRNARVSAGALILVAILAAAAFAQAAEDKAPSNGSILPFPPTPSASFAGPTLQESKHVRRVEPNRLPPDPTNILIVLLDDVGFGLPDTFGGEIATPMLTRLANENISYKRVSHDLGLLADAGCASLGAQPSAGRVRHHRRAGA